MGDAAILAEEVTAVKIFLERFDTTSGEFEKAHVANEMLNYLVSTRLLLNTQSFRKAILVKISELSTSASWPIMKEASARLCSRIHTEFDEPYSPGCLSALDMAAAAAAAAAPGVAAAAAPAPAHPFANMRAIGEGSFGAVFKPALPNKKNGVVQTYPENVTKAFYRKSNYNAIVAKAPQIQNLMGPNEGHRINTYVQSYKAGDLPDPIFDTLKSRAVSLNRSNNLHIVRMPDLGSDIGHIAEFYKEPRKVPFGTILEQIQKLIHQTARLAERGYGHFDIRQTNVMMRPDTGKLTIIDFDWLLPFDTLYNSYEWGFYNQPPEALMHEKFRTVLRYPPTTTDHVEEYASSAQLRNYVAYNIRSYKHAFEKYYNIVDQSQLKIATLESILDSVSYLISLKPSHPTAKEMFMNVVMPKNDNYGLGLTLLQMIAHVYVINGVDKASEKEILRDRISNNGAPYTEIQLSAIVDALFEVIGMLKRMASMKLRDRIPPAEAKTEIDRIVSNFKENMPAINENARAELNRMAFLAGNMPAVNNASPVVALSPNTRAELNRLRLLEGVMPSPKSTRKGRRSTKRRKTYRRRRAQL
jgi:hypothetical protein